MYYFSCALTIDCSISVWDIQRPYLPIASFCEHRDAIMGIAWRSDPNGLLSVGKDLYLYHHNFNDANHPIENANPVALTVSSLGNIACAVKTKDDVDPGVPTLVRQSSSKLVKKQSLIEAYGNVTSTMKIYECKDDSLLSSQIYKEFALNYKLSGKSIAEICEHNANVAKKLGKLQVCYFFIIKWLYIYIQILFLSSWDK